MNESIKELKELKELKEEAVNEYTNLIEQVLQFETISSPKEYVKFISIIGAVEKLKEAFEELDIDLEKIVKERFKSDEEEKIMKIVKGFF